jgi:hypothetical protein
MKTVKNIPILIKQILLVIGLLLICFFGYRYLNTLEVSKVVLKCKVTESIVSNEDMNNVLYYKVSKHLFSNDPVKLIASNPDTESKNLHPFISGYIDSSPVVKDVNFAKKYNDSKYYTFIFHLSEDFSTNSLPYVSSVMYLNREDLSMETYFIDDQKKFFTKEQCEVSSDTEFDKDWKSKVEAIKKKIKI